MAGCDAASPEPGLLQFYNTSSLPEDDESHFIQVMRQWIEKPEDRQVFNYLSSFLICFTANFLCSKFHRGVPLCWGVLSSSAPDSPSLPAQRHRMPCSQCVHTTLATLGRKRTQEKSAVREMKLSTVPVMPRTAYPYQWTDKERCLRSRGRFPGFVVSFAVFVSGTITLFVISDDKLV